jgi:cell division protein ZapA
MTEKGNLVQVEILGQTYSVRAGGDPGYVQKLAAFVDEQMKQTSRESGAVDSLRIAVLTALNLADETFRLRREIEEGRSRTSGQGAGSDDRLARLTRTLDAALRE